MVRSPFLRAGLLVVVLLAQFGLLLYGGAVLTGVVAPEAHVYPNEYALALNHDAYVGEQVEVTAEVVSTDPLVVTEEFAYRDVRLTVEGLDIEAEPGDTVSVFGVIEEGGVLRASDGFVVEDGSLRYAVVVSLLAGLWVLGRLLRGWRVDTTTGGLVPREERDA